VYGRGGEEVLACRAAGIAVDVTPGPSSVMSVPQAAGIPVTHRGTASAVHVISGQGGITATALQAMQDDDVTTVILMGVAALPRIVHAARDAGVPDDRPVAIIENGHTPQQRTTHSSLGAIVADAAAIGVRNPAVIVIGEVARAGLLLPVAEQQQAALRTGESTA
jgi:uroporphyrin-III C-methyltransferase/precorrin-2 dehydrogenase/sirohydrochlorin ferrochelatase